MIEIVKWSECFESADTRKRQRLGWFLSPSGCDSKGFRKLMRMGKDGLIALGFFQSLCQSMATQSIDARRSGVFINSDETLMDLDDILELSRLGGMEPADYRQVIGRLVSVGWISLHNSLESQQSADHLPPVCQSSPSFVQGEGEGEGKEQGEEKEKAENVLSLFSDQSPAPEKPKPTVSQEVLRIGRILNQNRRPTTLLSDSESKAFKACDFIEDEIVLVEAFYLATERHNEPLHRRTGLLSLLNHWPDEVGKARAWAKKYGYRPTAAKTNEPLPEGYK